MPANPATMPATPWRNICRTPDRPPPASSSAAIPFRKTRVRAAKGPPTWDRPTTMNKHYRFWNAKRRGNATPPFLCLDGICGIRETVCLILCLFPRKSVDTILIFFLTEIRKRHTDFQKSNSHEQFN